MANPLIILVPLLLGYQGTPSAANLEHTRGQLLHQVAKEEGWYDYRAEPKPGNIVIEWHHNNGRTDVVVKQGASRRK